MENIYQSYDVMVQKQKWDQNTQRVIAERLIKTEKFIFFQEDELKTLRPYLQVLLAEDREDILAIVIAMLDKTLNDNQINNYRQKDEPDIQVLVREGLVGLNQFSQEEYNIKFFHHLQYREQKQIVINLSRNTGVGFNWQKISPFKFFSRTLSLVVDIYYSLPPLWSEIGYGGPAYPRGYVRTQLGGWDPWEAEKV